MTAVQKRDQPCSLGYSAGRVCTQALCWGSSVKKTPIQANPEGHLLVPHTPCLVYTLCVPRTLELGRLTVAATAETREQLFRVSLTSTFHLVSDVRRIGESAVLHLFCAW